jgi:beta-aspartyl-peptidase (threonine type)
MRPTLRPVPGLLAGLASCCPLPAPGVEPIETAEVEALLAAQAEAWGRGDFDAFMATYLDSEALTFVGSGGLTRGHAATLARYRLAYPDAAARGVLGFELLEVRPLGAGRTALVLGRWRLERGAPVAGTFSLVVERRPEGLRIVHDHSSADG